MKLLIVDKDGTLVIPKSDDKFVQHPEDQVLIEGVDKTIAQYIDDGWQVVVASNQGGVAAGHKTLESAIAEMRYCMTLLPQIQKAYFCPNLPPKQFGWLRYLGLWKTQCYLVTQEGDCTTPFQEWFCDEEMVLYTGTRWGRPQSYRKPDGLMLFLACLQAAPGSWPDKVLMVGDREEDRQAANTIHASFKWASDWNCNGGMCAT